MAASIKRTKRKFAQYTQQISERPHSLSRDRVEGSRLGTLPWTNSSSVLAFKGLVTRSRDVPTYSIEGDTSLAVARGITSHRQIAVKPQYTMQRYQATYNPQKSLTIDQVSSSLGPNVHNKKQLKHLWYDLYHFNHSNSSLKEAQEKAASKFAYIEISEMLSIREYESFAEKVLEYCMEIFKKASQDQRVLTDRETEGRSITSKLPSSVLTIHPGIKPPGVDRITSSHPALGLKGFTNVSSYASLLRQEPSILTALNTSLEGRQPYPPQYVPNRPVSTTRISEASPLKSQQPKSITSWDLSDPHNKENNCPTSPNEQPRGVSPHQGSGRRSPLVAAKFGPPDEQQQNTRQGSSSHDLVAFLEQFSKSRKKKDADVGVTHASSKELSNLEPAPTLDRREMTFGRSSSNYASFKHSPRNK